MPNFQIQNFPLPLSALQNLESEQGKRIHPKTKAINQHSGIDLAVTADTPIYSVADGTLIKIGTAEGVGKLIAIEHQEGVISLYYHLSSFNEDLKVGDIVTSGERIGNSGNGDGRFGYHLHFGLVDGNQLIGGITIKNRIYNRGIESGSLGFFESKASFLNPRHYLTDLAIRLAIENVASSNADYRSNPSDPNSVKSYSSLSDAQKGVIDVASDSYFPLTLQTNDHGRNLEGDLRSNRFVKSGSDGTVYKSSKPSENLFNFTDISGNEVYELQSPFFGQIEINDLDKKGQIILDGRVISNTALPLQDSKTNQLVENTWMLDHQGLDNTTKRYFLRRVFSGFHNIKMGTSKLFSALVLATLLIGTAEAGEIQSHSTKVSKPKYDEMLKELIYSKIDEANKNPNYDLYKNLTREEKIVRLEMMKERYPIGWYEKMFLVSSDGFLPEDCDGPDGDKNYRCRHSKMLHRLTENQIISIFLHCDDQYQRMCAGYQGGSIIGNVMIISNIEDYVSRYSESSTRNIFDKNSLTARELRLMIRDRLILNKFRQYIAPSLKEKLSSI